MTRAELLAELRDVLDDTRTPFAWSDMRLLGYLSEGQDKFCEETGLFSVVESLALEAGVLSYAIPPRTIQVLDVLYRGRSLQKMLMNDSYWRMPAMPPVAAPQAWQADLMTGRIILDGTPPASLGGQLLELRLWKYSEHELSSMPDGQPAQPALPSTLQRACVEWAAAKALNHHDREEQDPVKAIDHREEFRRYVTDGKKWARRYASFEMSVGSNPSYVVSP